MAEKQSFDDLRVRYAEQVERVQSVIAEKPEAERPPLERRVNEIQSRLAHMQPLGLRSVSLTEKPSDGGVYSEANIDRDQLERLREPDVRAQVDTALRGTGISSSVVIARVETGAQNAALERQWIADDLQQVAETDSLNLERKSDLEAAREALNRAHLQLGITLERNEVLRDDGAIEEQQEELFADRGERLTEVTSQSDAESAVADPPRLDGQVQGVIDHERAGNLTSPFVDDAQRLSYREAVERELDEERIDRLREGDVDVLKDQIEDRLDRLYAAKAFLKSDATTANSEAARAVVEEIADREYELHRADLVDGESERGETH